MWASYRDTYISVCWRCGHHLFWDFRRDSWVTAGRGVHCSAGKQGHLSSSPTPVDVTAVTRDGESVL